MQTTNRNQWRSYLLAVTSISINLAVIYTFLIPAAGNRQVAKFEFPSEFGLAKEVTITKDVVEQAGTATETIQARQQYRYGRDRAIALEINYLVNTRGDVDTYLRDHTDISEKAIAAKSIRSIEGIGYYALLADKDRTYLTSCISRSSPANVTQKQFSQYRYEQDLSWQIGWRWLQGKTSIRDRRCLWVLLSTPANRNNLQTRYRHLEAAWQNIYRWWLPNFPSLVQD